MAKRIVGLMPPHLHYVEPYFGGGAVLFARDPDRDWYEGSPEYDGSAEMRGCSEVVNDINGGLVNFWRTLQDDDAFAAFYRVVEATPFSQARWQAAVQYNQDNMPRETPCVVSAVNFFIRYRQSRQGLGKDFATLSRNRTRRGMNEQVASWLSTVEGLPKAHERLKRVVILNDDAIDVIRQQDGPRTHYYIDPPYLHETRTATRCYEHEMTEEQHAKLLDVLAGIKGTFQLSGYHNRWYNATAKARGWHCVEFELPNNASGAKTKRRMTECLWVNYPVGVSGWCKAANAN